MFTKSLWSDRFFGVCFWVDNVKFCVGLHVALTRWQYNVSLFLLVLSQTVFLDSSEHVIE